MFSTFAGLAVALLALLPGASYTYTYERLVGGFGVSLSDRLVRFLTASALFQALFSGLTYSLYRHYRNAATNGHLGAGAVEIAALAYVLIPIGTGAIIGHGANENWAWVKAIIGPAPEPRAWDYSWRRGTAGIVRLRMKSGTWLAGVYATTEPGGRSYAAGFPEEGDLWLSRQLGVDPDSGAFQVDNEGAPKYLTSGLLVRWAEVEYLDFQEIENGEDGQGTSHSGNE